MENVFLHLLNMSLTAGILVVAVLLLRVVLHKAPRWIHVLLWALVAVRLLCPFTIESNLSLMPDTPAVSVPAPAPAPDTPPVENTVPDTPVVDSPTVIPPVTEDPSVIPPVVDTPPMTVIPPATDTPVVTPTPESSVVTATPETVVTPWQMVLTVATYAWLAGVALLAAYAVFTTLRLRRQVGEAAHIADNLWQCDHLRSPFILGLFRPRIYLPSDLSAAARDSVVAHEQAHLRRRDHWWKPLGFVLLMVYWFNPLMWVAYVFLCRDIEAACDESVVRNMNAADRRAYSEALLSCSAPRRLVSACPLAFGETAVKSRIKSVLSYKKPTIWIIVAALLVSTVAGVCLLTNRPADKPDTDKPAVSDKDDDPDAEPQYAVFTHVQQPYAQVTLEIGGNRCTYTNSVLSSAMLLEGTYEMGEDTVTMTFPDDAMTLVFKGDFTGLTFCNADSRYQEEYLTFGGYTLPDGAVFERQEETAPDDGTTPPPSYPTAFNAQVTGTVLEWHKEEEYLLLKVNPQFSEELGETLKVYTRYAPAGCAPEVGARLRILYGGYVQEGTPNAIYAASLFEPTAYHLIKTGVDLYDNLLKEIADYCYGLAPSAKAPDCSYLIFNEHIDPMFAIGIKVMDLDKNGHKELLISAMDWPDGVTPFVYDAYTIKDGKLVHLLSSGERSRYYLRKDGYIEHQWAGGAAHSGTDFYRLVDGSLTFVERVTYDADYAVESGLAADLPSVTGDMPWFHTTQIPGDSHKGYKHITEQQAKDIIADFTADHPLLNVNFLCLETGVAGSPDDDDPPTTGTTTTPTTPATKPSTPSLTAPSTDIATCVDGNYYYFVQPNEKVLYRRDLTVKDPSAPNALKKITDFLGCSNLRVKDGRIFYLKGHNLYSCRDDGSDVRLIDGDDDVLSFDIAGAWIFSVKKHMSVNREKLFIYRTDGSQRQQLTMGTVGGGAYITIYGFNRGKCYLKMESYGYTGSDIPSSSNDLTYQTFTGTYTVDYRTDSPKMEEVDLGWELEWYSSAEDNSLHNDYFSAYVYKQHRFYNIQTGEEIMSSGSGGTRLNDYTVRLITDNYGNGSSLMFTDYKGKATGVPIPYVIGTTYDYTSLRPEINLLGNMACVYQKNTTTGANRMLLVGADGSSFVLYTDTVDVGITHTVEAWISEGELEDIFGSSMIKRFNTRAGLVDFLTYYMGEGTRARWKISDFDCFDDAFFADNAVLLTYHITHSGSHTPYVVSYTYQGSTLRVGLDVSTPYVGDDGIGNWWLFSGIAKADLTFVNQMEAYVRATIPENHYAAVFNQLTEHPDKATERWRKFLRDDEDMEELWLLWEQWDKENRWVDATSVNRAFLFEGAINLEKHTYYVTSDHTALLRDDGKLIWLTQEESDLVQRVITAAAEG